MAWNNIIGHDRIKKILQKAIVGDRVAGAYCLWGIPGIGKEALAIEFARAANCENPSIAPDSIESCGQCKSCRDIDELNHPNLNLVFPLPAGKGSDSKSDSPYSSLSDQQIDEIQEQIRAKSGDPYYKIIPTNATQIKIASIRDVKKKLTLSGSRRGRRCILISSAEMLTGEAANAFLKTLEEPHPGVTIFMVTSRPDMLLPTIMSRCQQIRCEPLTDGQIASALVERHDIDPDNARLVAVYGRGSYVRALEFLGEDMRRLRTDMVDMLRTSMKKRRFRLELLEQIDELIKTSDKSRLETALNILLMWMRDANMLRLIDSAEGMINQDQRDTIEKFIKVFPDADLAESIEKIDNAIRDIRRNVNPQLIFAGLFLELREIFIENSL
ncbi:MAG: ATP-binding protein [Candidatus Kapaibacterium sp.]